MRGGPKAASDSPPSLTAGEASKRWPAARRLRSSVQFLAVTSDPAAIRCGGRWLSIACRVVPAAAAASAPVRFGFTASRRQARRAVDRNAFKRVTREAARNRLAELDAAAGDRSVDVVMRLRATAPDGGPGERHSWKAALRAEADDLLDTLVRRLRRATPTRR